MNLGMLGALPLLIGIALLLWGVHAQRPHTVTAGFVFLALGFGWAARGIAEAWRRSQKQASALARSVLAHLQATTAQAKGPIVRTEGESYARLECPCGSTITGSENWHDWGAWIDKHYDHSDGTILEAATGRRVFLAKPKKDRAGQ